MTSTNMFSSAIPMDTAICRTRRFAGWLLKARRGYRAHLDLFGTAIEAAYYPSANVDVVAIAGTESDAAEGLRQLAPGRTRSLIAVHLGGGVGAEGPTFSLVLFEDGAARLFTGLKLYFRIPFGWILSDGDRHFVLTPSGICRRARAPWTSPENREVMGLLAGSLFARGVGKG